MGRTAGLTISGTEGRGWLVNGEDGDRLMLCTSESGVVCQGVSAMGKSRRRWGGGSSVDRARYTFLSAGQF